ncbi:MAG TPA: ribbon-helix-helix protein, CopG family [Aquificaceae bacterium]|nr:ribbon-helix-helix protein, CopG family [Aquificaceae bacterium]
MIQRVTVSLEKELVEELKSIAKKEGLSLSKFIAKSLKEYVIEKRKKEAGKKLLKIKLSKKEVEKAFEELWSIRKEETSSWNL